MDSIVIGPDHDALRHRINTLAARELRSFFAWARIAQAEGRPVAYALMTPDDLAYWHHICDQVEYERL